MSDLQCPATLLIARHADEQHAQDDLTPDDGGALTDNGRMQVRNLVEQVRGRRIAEVYSSTMPLAVRSAEFASSDLGVPHIVVEGLQECSLGQLDGSSYEDLRAHRILDGWLHGDLAAASPGAESAQTVVRRFRDAVVHIADTHRGEAVLVFTHGAVMSLAVPCLSLNVRDDLLRKGFCQAVPPLRSRLTPTAGASCLGQVRPTCREPHQVAISAAAFGVADTQVHIEHLERCGNSSGVTHCAPFVCSYPMCTPRVSDVYPPTDGALIGWGETMVPVGWAACCSSAGAVYALQASAT